MPSHVDPYVRSATSLAYSRTLDLLRRQMGPHFDLEKLWEKHTYYVSLLQRSSHYVELTTVLS